MLALKVFRSKAKGLPDLLNYAAQVSDGVILGKDGSLMAAARFTGPDLGSSSPFEMDALSGQVNLALKRLGSGWMIHVDATRIPAPGYAAEGAFQDRTTACIDMERRLQYDREDAHFESVYGLTLTYLPPADVERRFSAMFIEDTTPKSEGKVEGAERVLAYFNEIVTEVLDNLKPAFSNNIYRLEGDALLTYVHSALTGSSHPVTYPQHMYLDALLGCRDLVGGMYPRLGSHYIKAISITGLPAEAQPSILDFMNHRAVSYRWTTRFIFMDPHEAEGELVKYRKNWAKKRFGMGTLMKQALRVEGGATWQNNDAVNSANDVDEAITESSEGWVAFGYYTSTIILMGEDKEQLDSVARDTVKTLGSNGFPAIIEDVNAIEAWLGSLPSHGVQNVRRPLIHTINLAHLLPLTSVWPGAEFSPNPNLPPKSAPLAYAATQGSTPFRLNLHVGDVGHTAVLGPTGAGKSTLLTFLVAQYFRYANAQVFFFDKGFSAYAIAKATGGEHYDIGGEDSKLAFCPLANLSTPADIAWAADWIEGMYTLQSPEVMTPSQRSAIHKALLLMSQSESRTITDFQNTIQDNAIREALAPYALGGQIGHLLDAERDGLDSKSSFQVFETGSLMSMGPKNVVPVLQYLFRAVEKRLDGRPTLIVLDEAWTMLEHPLFAAKMRQWLKELRKANAAVVFATQSLADVTKSDISSVIMESCWTKIFLPNAEARTENSREFYRLIGMNETQIDIIAGSIPKQHYYITSPLGRRLVDLRLQGFTLAYVAQSGPESKRLIDEFIAKYGEDWPAAWMEHRYNRKDWADYWSKLNLRKGAAS